MKTVNPLYVFTGLAVAGLAAVAGLTYDRWSPARMTAQLPAVTVPPEPKNEAPKQVAAVPEETSKAPKAAPRPIAEAPAKVETVPAEPQSDTAKEPAQVAAAPAQPAGEKPAKAPEPAPEPAAKQPEAAAKIAAAPSAAAPETPAPPEPPKEPALDTVKVPEPAPEPVAKQPQPAAKVATAPETPAPAEPSNKPTFDTVRVEASGEAIAAGEAAPNAEVTLKLDGRPIGKTVASKDGSWVVIPDKPLQPGVGALSVEQKEAGKTEPVVSEQTVAVAVPEAPKSKPMVVLVEPQAPARVIQTPSADDSVIAGMVALDSIDYNDSGDILFAGRAAAGSAVRIYIDNKSAGQAVADASGRWFFTGRSNIPTGNHALRIDRIDTKGKVVSRVELPFVREEPARAAALAPKAAGAPEPSAPQAASGEGNAQGSAVPSDLQAAMTPIAEAGSETSAPQATEEQKTEVAAAAPAETDNPKSGHVIIQPGNNLWKLSRVIYGKGMNYTVIFEANKTQIRDPDLIYPGQIFATPNSVPPDRIDPKRKKPLTPEEGGTTLP